MEVIVWLNAKFWGRVISRKAEVEWPPYSPDLNPLNYFIWSYAMNHVRRREPTTIDELKETVEDVAHTVPEQMIRDAVANIRKRCKACVLVARIGHRADSDGRIVTRHKPSTCNIVFTYLKCEITKKRVLHVFIPHILF